MLIGLSGFAGAGKDEVARILVENAGFERRAFADKLKELVGPVDKSTPEGRALLQNVGLGARALFGADFWIRNLGPLPELCVISDVRFVNEHEFIADHGGQVWNIRRPGVGPANHHVSDTEHLQCVAHRVIFNNGTLEQLKGKVLDGLAGRS